MSIELVWKGPLPGVLLPGAQQVWHVCAPETEPTDSPAQTLRLPALNNVNIQIRLPYDAERVLSIDPVDAASLWPFPSKRHNDYHVYNATCVSSDGSAVYFVDDEQYDVLLLAYEVTTKQLRTFASLDYNDYFERTFVSSPQGLIFAGSGVGLEIFSVDGETTSDNRRSYDAATIAVSATRYAIFSNDLSVVRSFQKNGVEEFSLSGFTTGEMSYQFDYRSEDRWPVTGVWLDRQDRLWLSGRGMACLSGTGNLLKFYSNDEMDGWAYERFIGIDAAGLMWFEKEQEYAAFFAPEMWGHSLSPALKKGVGRTGLEPCI